MGIDAARFGEYKRATRRRDFFRTSAYVLGGAAVLTTGVALAMYWLDQPSTEGIRVVPAQPGPASSEGFDVGVRFAA